MTGDIHEVSLTLGKLLSTVSEGERQRDAMFKKLDNIADTVTQGMGAINLLSKDQGEMKKKIDAHEVAIDELQNLKQQGLGMWKMGAIGVGSGGFVAGVLKFFGWVP